MPALHDILLIRTDDRFWERLLFRLCSVRLSKGRLNLPRLQQVQNLTLSVC